MNGKLIISSALLAALALGGCSGMSSSEQSTLSGAGIGTAAGVVIGAATGEWAWAAAGAAIGAGTGYLVDKEKQKQQAAQQKAYNEGLQAGKAQAQK